jgi:catechol 2,3-dioxygenase-like lactoylglutathione lyase family enzyme
VDMKLEVVVLPVADVDRAKAFYQALGWREDADVTTGQDFRVVQMTPPGSTCSVIFGTGLTGAVPGQRRDCSSSSITSTRRGPSSPRRVLRSATSSMTPAGSFTTLGRPAG